MNNLLINAKSIYSVTINKAKQSTIAKYYPYEPEKRIFFGLIKINDETLSSWYHSWNGEFKGRKALVNSDDTLYINHSVSEYEKTIWVKPYLIIRVLGQVSTKIYYDTMDELMNAVEVIKNTNKDIILI